MKHLVLIRPNKNDVAERKDKHIPNVDVACMMMIHMHFFHIFMVRFYFMCISLD